MYQSNYEVDILVNGHPIKEYLKDGKIYVEAKKGQEYGIRIKNNSRERILAIPTVDGLSVIDGEKGSFDSLGYIIEPYSSTIIDGWRTDRDNVAKFYFSDSADSYNHLRGEDGNNLGVVGVVIFKEYIPDNTYFRHYYFLGDSFNKKDWMVNTYHTVTSPSLPVTVSYFTASSKSLSTSNANDIGTGWGETKRSQIKEINFEKERFPTAIFEIFYNTKENLEKMGVMERPRYANAFPGQFCKPPKK